MIHTKGPWVAELEMPQSVQDFEGMPICRITKDCQEETYIGNAHLIAAAPEMLEALEQAWACIEHIKETSDMKDAAIETMAEIKRAILKARGEP